MAAAKDTLTSARPVKSKEDARTTLARESSSEFVFAVVGYAGSGTSAVAKALAVLLKDASFHGKKFDVVELKARDVIIDWARDRGTALAESEGKKKLMVVEQLQDLGDEMRGELTSSGKPDYAAVARELVRRIRSSRAQRIGLQGIPSGTVVPDGNPRAYILDSIRHPAEVQLLRHLYENAFILIGVVCEPSNRLNRIQTKYTDAGKGSAELFMERDAAAGNDHGQNVEEAFHQADFFIDNTVSREKQDGRPNPEWKLSERLSRLVKMITHSEVIRPSPAETAMYHAHSAKMQSACLSRQVGAAIIDSGGNIIATGTNEVAQAGGGVYGERISSEKSMDGRCAYHKGLCSNTKEQNAIVEDLLKSDELRGLEPEKKTALAKKLRAGKIGQLLEFSRAIHAEMDAVLSAARKGVCVVGGRLFVTTFPCHYCARHIVAAGIDEVQYIEPYPKSDALKLHEDSIAVEKTIGWKYPSEGGERVLFRPFSGVAPGLFARVFLKDRRLKERDSGLVTLDSKPDWTNSFYLPRSSYVDREALLLDGENFNA